jgi:ABC-type glycerol-3-phosphate transport system substrate-binding protein
MKTMMRITTVAAALSILLSACGGSPTATNKAGTAGPSYDGGYTIGSGNREMPTDTTEEAGNNPTTQSTQGFTLGSGN